MTEASGLAPWLPVAGGTLVAAVFGGMSFFAFLFAALVFAKLPTATAGNFIRAVFPVYYKVIGALAVASGLLLLPGGDGFVMIAVGSGFFLVMLLLMPRINAARDASLADAAANGAGLPAKRFAALHRLSVIINFVQMLVVLAVLVRLLA